MFGIGSMAGNGSFAKEIGQHSLLDGNQKAARDFFQFLNFLVLATMILMVRPGFYLKRKLNIVALKVFPATGSLLLIFGFILQLIGPFSENTIACRLIACG